jgi:hypothetical protein
MEPDIRLVHWYDTERHRIACGAAGHSNSTKHPRGVTCEACLTVVAEARAASHAAEDAASYVH